MSVYDKLGSMRAIEIEIPGSKSYTNRALIMAALTKGTVTLYNPLYSEDTEAMIGCLRQLGLNIATFPNQVIVYDDISIVFDKSYELFARDSGTTLRFLLPLLCLIPGTKIIQGTARLNERPIQALVDALRGLGADIEGFPLRIKKSNLGHSAKINASMSSQFLSALLLVSPLLNGLKIDVEGELISRPYIEMTLQMMREAGVKVEGYSIAPGQRYKKKEYLVEGDYSSAGYFFAMSALKRSVITLKNLNIGSFQADRKFLSILGKMGNEIFLGRDQVTFVGKKVLPMSINMEDCPDQVQTMAVLAAFAKGTTIISGIRSLRVKETERVKALKIELAKMGIQTEDTHDRLTIYGGNPHAASIETYGDHRMAMAFAVAKTQLPEIKILNPEVVNKTFPEFWEKASCLF